MQTSSRSTKRTQSSRACTFRQVALLLLTFLITHSLTHFLTHLPTYLLHTVVRLLTYLLTYLLTTQGTFNYNGFKVEGEHYLVWLQRATNGQPSSAKTIGQLLPQVRCPQRLHA